MVKQHSEEIWISNKKNLRKNGANIELILIHQMKIAKKNNIILLHMESKCLLKEQEGGHQ